MSIQTIEQAFWTDGGGGNVTLIFDDVALTVNQVKIVNGTVPMHISCILNGVQRGGNIPANLNQTVTLTPAVPYTTAVVNGRTTFDFKITNISVAPQ